MSRASLVVPEAGVAIADAETGGPRAFAARALIAASAPRPHPRLAEKSR